MTPTNHFQQVLPLLHALLCIFTSICRQSRVLAAMLPRIELHPDSWQTPRLLQAQEHAKILFRLHAIAQLFMSYILHRCQHGSTAPSSLTMDSAMRHRAHEHNT
jgi:hypothetical protein